MDQTIFNQVREGDYERFLCIQLAPPEKRVALYTISAFALELAQTAEQVSETLIGHIRLAWWREALEEIETGKAPRKHPIVEALAELHTQHPKVFPLLYQMIEGRAAELDTELMQMEEDWLTYLDETAGAHHLAWALVLEPNLSEQEKAQISKEARAYARVGLLRAIPFMASSGLNRYPAAKINLMQIGELISNGILFNFVKNECIQAQLELAKTRYKRVLKPIAALRRVSTFYIARLRTAKYDPHQLRKSRFLIVLKILQTRG